MSLIKISRDGHTDHAILSRPAATNASSFERSREYLYADDAKGCYLGFSGPIADGCEFASFPANELAIVVTGEMKISDRHGIVTVLREGDAAVIPRGLNCTIDQSQLGKRAFLLFRAPSQPDQSRQPGIVKVDPGARMEQCPFSLPAGLLTSSPIPVSSKYVAYADEQAGFSVGLWACNPYSRRPITIGHNEFMQLLDGSCSLTGDNGVTASLEKGDMLFIPRGSVFDWKSLVDVTKLYGSQS